MFVSVCECIGVYMILHSIPLFDGYIDISYSLLCARLFVCKLYVNLIVVWLSGFWGIFVFVSAPVHSRLGLILCF